MASLFTKEKSVKAAPRTAGSIAGEQFLTNLINQSPNIPTQEVAGLTPIQQAIQQALGTSLTNIQESSNLARSEYEKTLSDGYDPLTSPEYAATRKELERLKTKGVTADRQRAQQVGGLMSTPAAGVESQTRQNYDSLIMQALADLTSKERDRKTQAAKDMGTLESQNVQNLANVSNVADVERQIEQQKNNALYQQALMEILYPYEQMASIAQSLMNYQMPTVTTGGGLTDLGFYANMTSQIAAQSAGAMAGA